MSDQIATDQANAVQPDAAAQVASQEEHAAREEVAQAFGVQIPQEQIAESQEVVTEQQTEQQPTTEQETGEPKEGTLDHKLMSLAGRRLAEHERRITETVQQTLSQFLERIPGVQQAQQQPTVQTLGIPDIDPQGVAVTNEDVLKLIEKRDTAVAQQQQAYWTGYQQTIGTLANQYKLNPDQVKAVQVEMEAAGHQRHSGDPRVSAQLNFYQALTASMAKALQGQKSVVPVNGKAPIGPTGVPTSQRTDTAKTETVSVDADTRKILSAFNLGDDFVQKVQKDIKG